MNVAEWAGKKVGTEMKTPSGESCIVTGFKRTKNGRGVWFFMKNGKQVYREHPDVKGSRSKR